MVFYDEKTIIKSIKFKISYSFISVSRKGKEKLLRKRKTIVFSGEVYKDKVSDTSKCKETGFVMQISQTAWVF